MITWTLQNPGDGGFPSSSDNDALENFENLIFDQLEAGQHSICVAVITNNGERDWIFYTSDPEEIHQRLNQALQESPRFPIRPSSCPDLTEPCLRKATRVCRDEIYADKLTYGGQVDDPFVNLVVGGNTAVFTFFTSPFEFYIFECDPEALIRDFEAGLAMSDVDIHRQRLAQRYDKIEPDAVVDRSIAEHWMETC